jgi:hypothetical protein
VTPSPTRAKLKAFDDAIETVPEVNATNDREAGELEWGAPEW